MGQIDHYNRRWWWWWILIFFIFVAIAAPSSLKNNWYFVVICVFMFLLVDYMFMDDSQFIYEPNFKQWEFKACYETVNACREDIFPMETTRRRQAQ